MKILLVVSMTLFSLVAFTQADESELLGGPIDESVILETEGIEPVISEQDITSFVKDLESDKLTNQEAAEIGERFAFILSNGDDAQSLTHKAQYATTPNENRYQNYRQHHHNYRRGHSGYRPYVPPARNFRRGHSGYRPHPPIVIQPIRPLVITTCVVSRYRDCPSDPRLLHGSECSCYTSNGYNYWYQPGVVITRRVR